jgi:hypothetical protein
MSRVVGRPAAISKGTDANAQQSAVGAIQKQSTFAHFQADRTGHCSPPLPHAAVQGDAQNETEAQFPQPLSLSLSASTTQADSNEHPPENPQPHTIAQSFRFPPLANRKGDHWMAQIQNGDIQQY